MIRFHLSQWLDAMIEPQKLRQTFHIIHTNHQTEKRSSDNIFQCKESAKRIFRGIQKHI
jgi:hypothetical protein